MKIKRRRADQVFSKWIRARDKYTCQRCLKQYPGNSQGLHCAHCFGRRFESTRFDPDNCLALCFGCHRLVDEDHSEKIALWKKRIGEKAYERLERRHYVITKKDDAMVVLIYSKLLKKMEA